MKNYKNVCMEIDPESDTEADDVFVMDKVIKLFVVVVVVNQY